MKTDLQIALAIEKGQLAIGDITRRTFEDVRVTCHRCGGVTVFPVFFDQPRKVGPCLHCGERV